RFSRDWSSDVCSSDLFDNNRLAAFAVLAEAIIQQRVNFARQVLQTRLLKVLGIGGAPNGGDVGFDLVLKLLDLRLDALQMPLLHLQVDFGRIDIAHAGLGVGQRSE